MNRMKLYALIAALCVLTYEGNTAKAQQIANGKILIDSVKTLKAGNKMNVAFRMNLDNLKLKSEQQLVFTPMLTGKDSIALRPIIVNGKNQQIRYNRLSDQKKNAQALVVKRKNGTSQSVAYTASVPYEKWMQQLTLSMSEDLCGCGKLDEQDKTTLVTIDHRPRITPDFYVRPKAEAVKVRAEKGEAYLSFPVNRSAILADFRDNAKELAKITSTIALVKNDKNVSITNIDIHGYASPDGPYANNERLANERSSALRNYVSGLYTLDSKLFTYHATAEDWAGFEKKIAESELSDRAAILNIANSNLAPDDKDRKIRSEHPQSYRYIIDNIYPRLRHSDYTVTYTVRPFNIEESKELLKTKPQMLSLQEMYLVAQTYEPGSPEFNEVFDVAVKMFPEDETANLNAACTDLQKGDFTAADKHLAKAGISAEAERVRNIALLMKQAAEE